MLISTVQLLTAGAGGDALGSDDDEAFWKK
jgi:hypothetical protein